MNRFAPLLAALMIAPVAVAADAPAPKPAPPPPPSQAQAPPSPAPPTPAQPQAPSSSPAPSAPGSAETAEAPAAPINRKIYTCPDGSGDLVYQDDPCDDPNVAKHRKQAADRPKATPPAAADVAVLEAPIPRSDARTKPAAKSKLRAPAGEVVIASRTAPASGAPVEARASAASMAEMRAWIDREVAAAGGIAPTPRVPAGGSSGKPLPIRPVIDTHVFTSDPRWGSPERTLSTFIAAMRQGDGHAAKACLTAGALAELGERLEQTPADALKAEVAGYRRLVPEGEIGPYWSIRALRDNARPKWILFERVGDGTWKISSI